MCFTVLRFEKVAEHFNDGDDCKPVENLEQERRERWEMKKRRCRINVNKK